MDAPAPLDRQRPAPGADPRSGSEERLEQRLAALARSAGVAVPRLEVLDPSGADDERLRAWVRWRPGGRHVVASHPLVGAPPAEQLWHLAACLGEWTSPAARRRRRSAAAAALVLFGSWMTWTFVLGVAGALDEHPHGRLLKVLTVLAGLCVPLVLAALRRGSVRAREAAGLAVLAAAGHSPAGIAREVFGGVPREPLHRRWASLEPPAHQRLAAAQRWTAPPTEPATPLY